MESIPGLIGPSHQRVIPAPLIIDRATYLGLSLRMQASAGVSVSVETEQKSPYLLSCCSRLMDMPRSDNDSQLDDKVHSAATDWVGCMSWYRTEHRAARLLTEAGVNNIGQACDSFA